jgi:hypothetical protein
MSGLEGFVSLFRVAWRGETRRGDVIDGSGRRTKRERERRESRVAVLVRRDSRERAGQGRGVERYSGIWVSGWIRREC